MKPYRPHKIYIEKDALNSPGAWRILKNLPGVPVEMIENPEIQKAPGSFFELTRKRNLGPSGSRDLIGEGKRSLLLKRDKGRSFKPFPESEPYLSCDYFTLHVAEGCDLECSYCILQAYLTNPFLTVYVNLEEMLENLEKILKENPDRFFRIGTGQLADSLSLDSITEFSKTLVPFFARQENAVLELKTKSTFIENLLGLDPAGKTVVSWSMNSKKIQVQEEHKCASIEERIQAAKKLLHCHPERSEGSQGKLREGSLAGDSSLPPVAQNDNGSGYRLGFHFDPIIDYPGWEKDYEEVIEMIFSEIPADRIAWISLGCLRFMPALKGIMQSRFPKSNLPLGEWITGMDGKMRYFKPRRVEIYRKMIAVINRHCRGGVSPPVRQASPPCVGTGDRYLFRPRPEKVPVPCSFERGNSAPTIYLSMESPEVWRRVFGTEPSRAEVCRLLDQVKKGAGYFSSPDWKSNRPPFSTLKP